MSALSKGKAWHSILELHYNILLAAQRKDVKKVSVILERARSEVATFILDLDDELAELMWWMYDGYVSLFGADEGWEIMAVEHPAQVRLPTPRGGRSSFILKMKIDLIIRDRSTRRIRIVDHKSGKDLPHRKNLELDDQFTLYTWGLNELGHHVFGQTYNAARTYRLKADLEESGIQPLDERFSRTGLYRTPVELQAVAVEAYQVARARYQQQAEARKDGIDSPRTTDTMSCQWQCDAFEPCLAGRKGADWRSMMRAKGLTQDFERH